jgi:glucose-6-phosphate isomerase
MVLLGNLFSPGQKESKSVPIRIIPELESKEEPSLEHDSSTNALIGRYRKLKEVLG